MVRKKKKKSKVKCVYCGDGKKGWVCKDCLGKIVYGDAYGND